MSDPASDAPTAAPTATEILTNEITRSLGTVWQRHSGARPGSISTEIRDNVIKCAITEAPESDADTDAEAEAEEQDPEAAARSTNSNSYKNEAIAAVARHTHRRVMAFIPKRDPKTDLATDTFILERSVTKY